MINGGNIRLRAVERADLPLFVLWLNDPEVRAGLEMFLPFSLAEEERWYERMLEAPAAEHVLAIDALDQDHWRLIGTCGLHKFDWRARAAEAGISIGDKTYWNKGHGTNVMRLLLQHGFDTLNLNRVYLSVYANNLRAIRCYEKTGFVLEGRMRQAHYQNGEYHDILLMSVLRSEWDQ